MMSSDRFKPVQRIADNRERKAAAQLGDSLKSRQQAAQQLADLRAYHAEYLEQYRQANLTGMSIARMREYQLFMDKLEGAIREQERAVQRAEAACTDAQSVWRDKYTRTQVMANVVDRMKSDERQQAAKREQAIQDDRPIPKDR
jgi:flagellar FliJ protein